MNNTLFVIDKHVNSSLQGAETGYVSAFSDGTADESAEEDFNWDEVVFENRVKPSFEVIDQDGLTVHKGEGVYVDWIIPSHLKTGKYTVLFRWGYGVCCRGSSEVLRNLHRRIGSRFRGYS